MKIHEYQGKEILRQFGVLVPNGIPAFTVQEAIEAAQKIGGDAWMVKAQIHAGGRGKGGGIKLAQSLDALKKIASDMLGMQLSTHQTDEQGQKVRRLLIEEKVDVQKEYYVSLITDRTSQTVAIIASSKGGVDIEEIARASPEKIIKLFVNPLTGIVDEQARQLAIDIGVPHIYVEQVAETFKKLYYVYMDTDADLIEVNPLVLENSGHIKVVDVKFSFDDNALFRHPDIYALRDLDEEGLGELEASKYGISYISLNGNIACLVNGAGLAMTMMDTIKQFGGEPANFLDVDGGAAKEKVTAAFEIILQNPKVDAILVNIFSGIMRCDTIASGIVAACKDASLKVPLVVRMKGAYEAQGRRILLESGLPIINADTMADAAKKAVVAAGKG